MIRQFADGGEPTTSARMLPWARTWNGPAAKVTELPDEFWPGPGR